MSETPNYKLYLSDDPAEKVMDWRKKMNGSENSNMLKIDAALSEKAERSVPVDGILLASGWIGDEAPYTQEITITATNMSKNGYISVSNGASLEQLEAACDAMLSVMSQNGEKIVIAANIEKPKIDIPVTTILIY